MFILFFSTIVSGFTPGDGGLHSSNVNEERYWTPIEQYPVYCTVEPGLQCGLYSLYAVSNALGKSIPLEQLIDGKYLSPEGGSTASQLLAAAKNFELPAHYVRFLDIDALRQSPTPSILLFDLGTNRQNHWVVWLGESGGKVIVYDSATGIQPLSISDLQCLWGGVRLYLVDQPPRFPCRYNPDCGR
jgi:ABC-type bacteriocin/lantibiotic exporter with double-glycine peptidase domain